MTPCVSPSSTKDVYTPRHAPILHYHHLLISADCNAVISGSVCHQAQRGSTVAADSFVNDDHISATVQEARSLLLLFYSESQENVSSNLVGTFKTERRKGRVVVFPFVLASTSPTSGVEQAPNGHHMCAAPFADTFWDFKEPVCDSSAEQKVRSLKSFKVAHSAVHWVVGHAAHRCFLQSSSLVQL